MTLMRSKRLTESENSSCLEFQIQSYDGTTWTEHCSGDAIAERTTNNHIDHDLKGGPLPLPRPVSSKGFYRSMARNGFHYGPEFALLDNITASATEKLAQASLIDRYDHCSAPFSFHPAELDNCLHFIFVAATQGLNRRLNQLYLPMRIAELTVHRAATYRMMAKAAVPSRDLSQCRIDSVNKEECETEQKLAYLYMLGEMSRIENVTTSKKHFETLRTWMQNQIQTGGFLLFAMPPD
ncbi:putative secondary metabolism biosynthetic enzyme [Pestalotiopsis sp. IQ-011]